MYIHIYIELGVVELNKTTTVYLVTCLYSSVFNFVFVSNSALFIYYYLILFKLNYQPFLIIEFYIRVNKIVPFFFVRLKRMLRL